MEINKFGVWPFQSKKRHLLCVCIKCDVEKLGANIRKFGRITENLETTRKFQDFSKIVRVIRIQ